MSNKTKKSLITSILTSLLSFVFVFVTCFALVKSDTNMNSKQGLPDLSDCSLNFEGYELNNSYLKQHMKGEYEFFYNRWIVEENYAGEPDCKVSVPHHYKDTTINGKKLSNEGYSSYRVYVKGLPIGTKIWFINNNFVGGFYAYINNEFVLKYGTRAKEGNCLSNGGDDMTLEYIVRDSSPLTVVFEVSSSCQGGLTSPARLVINTLGRNPTSQYLTNNIGFVVLGLILGLLVFSFVLNLGMTKRDFSFSLLMGVITMMVFFSIDVYWRVLSIIKTNTYNSIIFINLLVVMALTFALYYHLSKNKRIKPNKLYLISFGVIFAISIVLYFVLMGTFLQLIPLMLSLLGLVILMIPLSFGIFEGNKINIAFIVINLSLLVYYSVTFFDLENIMIAGTEQSISYILLPIIAIIIVLYRISTVSNTKKYIKALEGEKRAMEIKADTLMKQIKPHYIFNCLSSIEGAYEEDPNKGKKMLTSFSRELRESIDATSKKLSPFEEELERVLNYVDLENMRKEKKIEVLLDLECSNFSLPPLSLEPFVENAFKHAKLEEKEDGHILISSTEDDDSYVVTVEDNGVGFDAKEIKSSSVGIRNAKDRLKIVLNADTNIISSLGNGTKVEIRMPKKEKQE